MKLRSESVENLFLGLTSYRDTFRSVSWIIKGDVRTEKLSSIEACSSRLHAISELELYEA